MAAPVYSRIIPSEHAIGKPVTQSLMDRLRRNPLAILGVDEDDDTGAPHLPVPQSLVTAETDTNLSLYPDGSGGVRWGHLTQDYRLGDATGLANLGAGVWTVHAIASQPGDQDNPPRTWQGLAVVANGQLTMDFAILHSTGSYSPAFSLDGGILRFIPGVANGAIQSVMLAVRVA